MCICLSVFLHLKEAIAIVGGHLESKGVTKVLMYSQRPVASIHAPDAIIGTVVFFVFEKLRFSFLS